MLCSYGGFINLKSGKDAFYLKYHIHVVQPPLSAWPCPSSHDMQPPSYSTTGLMGKTSGMRCVILFVGAAKTIRFPFSIGANLDNPTSTD
jgi:hypothetical protein